MTSAASGLAVASARSPDRGAGLARPRPSARSASERSRFSGSEALRARPRHPPSGGRERGRHRWRRDGPSRDPHRACSARSLLRSPARPANHACPDPLFTARRFAPRHRLEVDRPNVLLRLASLSARSFTSVNRRRRLPRPARFRSDPCLAFRSDSALVPVQAPFPCQPPSTRSEPDYPNPYLTFYVGGG